MKIALLGYGKMGQNIEYVVNQHHKGDEIILKVNSTNQLLISESALQEADVAIEFSSPQTAVANIEKCLSAGIPIVVGSTGWYSKLNYVKALVKDNDGALVYGSNFSIGMNIMFELNKKLTHMINRFPNFDIKMEEIHHKEKKDSPSGTAIQLAEDILDIHDQKKEWKLEEDLDWNKRDQLSIKALRKEGVKGVHTVISEDAIDYISISHEAKDRSGFSNGALLAAKWLCDRKGVYHFREVLDF
ncbi:UNVERIFIED_CONTAM: hypothetical protein GTU68_019159 [Idotea baltica]|nr:hypothetical protein [Idotea baltica]